MHSASDGLLLDFDLDPLLEALDVDGAAGPHAFAGVDEEVIDGLGLLEADFAGMDFLGGGVGCELENFSVAIGEFMLGVRQGLFASKTYFTHEVFHAAQFHNLPNPCVTLLVPNLYPIDPPTLFFSLLTTR